MKRCWIALAALALSVFLAMPAVAVQVTDDQGTVLNLVKPPQRIVSLLPSLTETVCALGQCQRLVGVDRYSNFPESVKKLPQVGGGMDPNIEAIVALRPDLVLAALSSRSAARLVSLGIPVFTLEPKSHADVQRAIRILGQLLQVTDAPKLWQRIDADMNAVAAAVPPALRGQRVYFEVNRGPYGASEGSFIGETLTRLGFANILPASLGPFPRINPELVVRENPDLIMLGEANMQDLAQRPGWRAIRAVRENRLCLFDGSAADILVRPGPRMAEAARLMARCATDKAGAATPAAVRP